MSLKKCSRFDISKIRESASWDEMGAISNGATILLAICVYRIASAPFQFLV